MLREVLALEEVRRYFNVHGVYDLFTYANCMPLLRAHLAQVRRDTYSPNDRLVFLLYDLDYTLHDWTPGFALYNLQLILQDLDISNYYALILTNRPDFMENTRQVQSQLTADSYAIRSITTFLDITWIEPVVRDANPDVIDRAFSLLCRQSRPHRTYFVAQFLQHGLDSNAYVGYHNIPFPHSQLVGEKQDVDPCDHLGLLRSPAASQRLVLRQLHNQTVFRDFSSKYSSLVNFEEDVDIGDKAARMMLSSPSPVQRALIYVGVETDVDLRQPHVSPISFRGIVERRPFVLLAATGTLRILRDLGFRVFDEFWDTSYDDVTDLESRVDHILEIMHDWGRLDPSRLRKKYQAMQRDIDYNYKFYREEFESSQRQRLRQALLVNQEGR